MKKTDTILALTLMCIVVIGISLPVLVTIYFQSINTQHKTKLEKEYIDRGYIPRRMP